MFIRECAMKIKKLVFIMFVLLIPLKVYARIQQFNIGMAGSMIGVQYRPLTFSWDGFFELQFSRNVSVQSVFGRWKVTECYIVDSIKVCDELKNFHVESNLLFTFTFDKSVHPFFFFFFNLSFMKNTIFMPHEIASSASGTRVSLVLSSGIVFLLSKRFSFRIQYNYELFSDFYKHHFIAGLSYSFFMKGRE